MKRLVVSVTLVLVLATAALSVNTRPTGAAPQKVTKPAPTVVPNQEYYDLLIEGIDRRPYQANGRSDVMVIVHCEPNRVTLFSIPRDTLVPVRGSTDKINHAYAYGGIRLSKATIENFLSFKIDNYITVDFETFLSTIDTVKALTNDGKLIGADNFLVNGENLLKWLRFRGYALGDRRRCQRHQLFIKRILLYAQDIFKNNRAIFSQVVKAGLKIAETDMTYEHVEELMNTYKDVNLEKNLERFVLPGSADARYKRENGTPRSSYDAKHMPDFNAVVAKEGLTGEAAAQRKAQLASAWRGQLVSVNYYIPKYKDWPLTKYLKWFRDSGLQMNYEEVDTLRK